MEEELKHLMPEAAVRPKEVLDESSRVVYDRSGSSAFICSFLTRFFYMLFFDEIFVVRKRVLGYNRKCIM